MSKNIKLISIVLFTLFSFFVLLKGLDRSNIYSPKIKESNIDFNFKAKYLFSEEEVFLNELLNNEGMSLINIWASWCLPCRNEHAYLLNLKSLNKLNIIGINYKDDKKNAKQFLIELGAFGVPETYLVDNKSKSIIQKFIGPLDDEAFAKLTKIIQ